MPLRRIRADRAAAPALLLGYSHVVADGSPQCRGAVIASLGTSALHFFASRELSFASRQLDRATASLGRPQGYTVDSCIQRALQRPWPACRGP